MRTLTNFLILLMTAFFVAAILPLTTPVAAFLGVYAVGVTSFSFCAVGVVFVCAAISSSLVK